jgi:hypothetical protein
MVPEELTKANFSSALDGAVIFYFDVRLHDTALFVAEEVISSRHNRLTPLEQNKIYFRSFCNFECK